MNEKLKDIQTKAKDFWNKYDKKQKRLIVSIFAVVVVAVIILAVVLSRPTYETLIECTDTTNAADIADTLTRIVPLEADYMHAHFLPSYGATGNNSTGHIKSLLCGNHCMFPVVNGKIVCGGAQDIYLVEFDGPQTRRVYVEIIGE